MSDYKDWAEDNINVRDHLACANKPPTVRDKCIEEASGIAEAPASATHTPDPTHLNMPEDSSHTEDDKDVDKPASEGGNTDDNVGGEREESPAGDVIIEEEYCEQEEEEELDYEDNAPNEEQEQDVEVNKSEQATNTEEIWPAIWGWLGDPINERASTDTENCEVANLMESVLGIQSPEGGCQTSEGYAALHSHRSDCQHRVLSDDN